MTRPMPLPAVCDDLATPLGSGEYVGPCALLPASESHATEVTQHSCPYSLSDLPATSHHTHQTTQTSPSPHNLHPKSCAFRLWFHNTPPAHRRRTCLLVGRWCHALCASGCATQAGAYFQGSGGDDEPRAVMAARGVQDDAQRTWRN